MPVLQNSNFNAQFVSSLPGPEWLRELRLASWGRFVSSELPRESEEIWRYSRIEDLDLDRYAPCPAGVGAGARRGRPPDVAPALVEAAGADATVVVSRNGGLGEVVCPQAGLEIGPPVRGRSGRPRNRSRSWPGPSRTFGQRSTAPWPKCRGG